MATFADVGKDINDQFTKDLATEQNVEVSAKVNNYFSFLLKGNVKGDKVDGTFAPTIKVPEYNVEVKPELTTPDSKEKTFKVDVSANDVFKVAGLKVELGTSNGKEGENFVGAAYKNAKFGGVTARLSFPSGKDKYITPSVYISNNDTRGFGAGANAKVVLGDNASVETYKALVSYKQGCISAFGGVESKVNKDYVDPITLAEKNAALKAAGKPVPEAPAVPEVPDHFYVLGGFLRSHENKQFGASGNYNTAKESFALELLFRKNYEDGTFLKIKSDLKGQVSVSKQFKPQSGVSVTLGTNVNVFSGKGNAGFQFSTDL